MINAGMRLKLSYPGPLGWTRHVLEVPNIVTKFEAVCNTLAEKAVEESKKKSGREAPWKLPSHCQLDVSKFDASKKTGILRCAKAENTPMAQRDLNPHNLEPKRRDEKQAWTAPSNWQGEIDETRECPVNLELQIDFEKK